MALVELSERLREGFKRVRDLYVEVMTTMDRAVDWLKVGHTILRRQMVVSYVTFS